ncbi:MAG: asparaginase [Vallitalea sp.]|nr:asparaginase [Vallitalea sp.]
MKKVALIFTGGTISMKVDERLKAAIPALSDKEIISKVSSIEKMAQLEIIHYGSYPGPHINPTMMFELYNITTELLDREDIDGVVITHGTDTLEETAYFLDLLIDSNKPVVITGSMRNSSELGYDGPANLSASICTVCSEESKNKGVLVVMNNEVNAADEVTKTHTLSLDTFQSMDFGPLGIVDSDQVIYYRNRIKGVKIKTNKVESKVGLIKAVAGIESDIINYYIDNDYKGIIIEAMGRGNIPPAMNEGINRAINNNIPVVLVSRCPKGRVLDSYGYDGGGRQLREMGVILGDSLSGQKARIKLMIVLGKTNNAQEVKEIFEKDLYKKM